MFEVDLWILKLESIRPDQTTNSGPSITTLMISGVCIILKEAGARATVPFKKQPCPGRRLSLGVENARLFRNLAIVLPSTKSSMTC